jgi:glycosyltransferase involved in cell wall biosynthesis
MIAALNSVLNVRSLPSRRMMVIRQMRQNRPHTINHNKHLLVDVSTIIQNDAHTGIQRVVRALLLQLFSNPPEGYKVLPVFCTRKHGYCYADTAFVLKFTSCIGKLPVGDVIVGNKDIFFGLDLSTHLLPIHEDEIFKWKKKGVKVYILMYDMLPYIHPEWFTPPAVKNFHRWLRTIAVYGDGVISISKTVQGEFRSWLKNQGFSVHTPRLNFIPLGSEFNATLPTHGINVYHKTVFRTLKNTKFILMVGTIEPRKGYDEVLTVMERLWNDSDEIVLVIVGKPGWKTASLQERMINHPQANKKLYWLKEISDNSLQKLYEMSIGVLVASLGEGFGLPIVEAMFYNKVLLVRDISVFHEISNGYSGIDYFKELTASLIIDWIRNIPTKIIDKFPTIKWEESQKKLISIILPYNKTIEYEPLSSKKNVYITRL